MTLVGPCHPADIKDVELHCSDASLTPQRFAGYRGMPVSDLAQALWRRGHDVAVVTTSTHPSPVLFTGDRFSLSAIPMRPRARDRARDLFRQERRLLVEAINSTPADVVHAHWTYEFALAALAQPIPALVTIHDAPLTVLRYARDPYRAARLAMAWLVRSRRPTLTAVSPHIGSQWKRELVCPDRVAVIPNMVSTDMLTSVATPGVPGRIVTIGNPSRLKNIRTLLAAWTTASAQDPLLDLHIVGPELTGPESLDLPEARHLGPRVHWHGSLDRSGLRHLIQSSELMVHPSREESFGLAVVEAMSLGVPVVAGRRSGAVPWVLDEGRAGYLVDVTDARAVAQGILRLHGNSALRSTLADAALRRVQRHFSPDSVASLYERRYAALT